MAPLILNRHQRELSGRFTDGPTEQEVGWAPEPIFALGRRGNSVAPIRIRTPNHSVVAIPT
jgi:hypothetical protein